MNPPRDLDHYDMSKNKILLIFNNRDFPKSKFRKAPFTSLSGNDGDQRLLTRVFTAFGFRVETHLNFTADQILDVIARLNEEEVDHSQTSCVCVAVMTHGDGGGTLHAADRSYNLRDLVEPLQFGHQGLVGKPKLFLVQACRGGDMDAGRVELDGPGGAALGSHADTLVLTACIEGFVAWGHDGGSWLLQELCGVMERRHCDLHLLDMATLTTSLVTRGHAARVMDEQARRLVLARETPESRSTLTKLLRFSLAQR